MHHYVAQVVRVFQVLCTHTNVHNAFEVPMNLVEGKINRQPCCIFKLVLRIVFFISVVFPKGKARLIEHSESYDHCG